MCFDLILRVVLFEGLLDFLPHFHHLSGLIFLLFRGDQHLVRFMRDDSLTELSSGVGIFVIELLPAVLILLAPAGPRCKYWKATNHSESETYSAQNERR